MVALPAETTTLPGTSGFVRGAPVAEDEAVPAPWLFTARTNTVYDVPLFSAVTPSDDAVEIVSGDVDVDAVRQVDPLSVEY